MRRVFLVVLDSLGIGELPDAKSFGDINCNTLKRISRSPNFRFESLKDMGMGNIDGLDFLPRQDRPKAAVCRLAERSAGKDTTIGHWEIAGLVSNTPLPTYPDGFPDEIIEEFSKATGRGVLCNKPFSGTEVIKEFGEEHTKTGKLIVYTSADSVFQIAAHEDIVGVEQLYEYCRIARKILCGKHAVGRVIARPFIGTPDSFKRTANRHDFSLEPWGKTLLDALKDEGRSVISIGKINDIFASRGVTEHIPSSSNSDGMDKLALTMKRDFEGLCFVNLVDFDMLYGHRQDIDGYAKAFAEFDRRLPSFIELLGDDDILIITADHGCDPGDDSTDHSREYTPLIIYGKNINPENLGTRQGFCDIAATVAEYLGISYRGDGTSILPKIIKTKEELSLCQAANEARKKAYAPYSTCSVGAALLCRNGRIYTGCNIENASFSPTVCAERTAIFKAVSEGERDFAMIAICGGVGDSLDRLFPPCGVCRQVMSEFCSPDMPVLLVNGKDSYSKIRLADLLPLSFGKECVK